jgi:PAS domain S-box-containing protein
VCDRDGRIALVNQHAEQLLGFSERELIGRASEELIAPDARDAHVRARTAFLAEPSEDGAPLLPGWTQLLTRTGKALAVLLEPRPLIAEDELWVSLTLRPQPR